MDTHAHQGRKRDTGTDDGQLDGEEIEKRCTVVVVVTTTTSTVDTPRGAQKPNCRGVHVGTYAGVQVAPCASLKMCRCHVRRRDRMLGVEIGGGGSGGGCVKEANAGWGWS